MIPHTQAADNVDVRRDLLSVGEDVRGQATPKGKQEHLRRLICDSVTEKDVAMDDYPDHMTASQGKGQGDLDVKIKCRVHILTIFQWNLPGGGVSN